MKNHYQLLNVEQNASQEQIRSAYLLLVQCWHPDKFSGDIDKQNEATEIIAEIISAYAVLRDPDKRKQYDNSIGRINAGGSHRENERKSERPFHFKSDEKVEKYCYGCNRNCNFISCRTEFYCLRCGWEHGFGYNQSHGIEPPPKVPVTSDRVTLSEFKWIILSGLFVLLCFYVSQGDYPGYLLARNANSIAACDEYLKNHIHGSFRKEITKLKSDLHESSLWNDCLNNRNNIHLLRVYLTEFPKGKNIGECQAMIKKISDDYFTGNNIGQSDNKKTILRYCRDYFDSSHVSSLMEKLRIMQNDFNWVSFNGDIEDCGNYLKNHDQDMKSRAIEARMINLEIDKIKEGNPADLPQATGVDVIPSRTSTILVTNKTYYNLTLMYSGNEVKKFNVPVGESLKIELISGHYRVAASVSGKVKPFYGEEDLIGQGYNVKYYINGDDQDIPNWLKNFKVK